MNDVRQTRYANRVKASWDCLVSDVERWKKAFRQDSLMAFHVGQFQMFCANAHARLVNEHDKYKKSIGIMESDDEQRMFESFVIGVLTSQWMLLRQVCQQRLPGNPYEEKLAELDRKAAGYYRQIASALGQTEICPPLTYLGQIDELLLFNRQAPMLLSVPFGVLTQPNIDAAIAHEIGHAFLAMKPKYFYALKNALIDDLANKGGYVPSVNVNTRQMSGGKSVGFPSVSLEPGQQKSVIHKMILGWLGEVVADIIGTLLYAGSLFSLIFGLSVIPDAEGGYLLVLAALLMIVFLRWELAAENPVVNVGVFRRNPVFLFSNLAALINYSSTFAVAYLLSLYLQYLKGFDPQTTGLILVAQPIVQVVFSPFAGRLSDRMEPRIVASAGMGLCVIGLTVFSFLTLETSLGLILASLMLLGLGFALFSSPNANAIMSAVEPCYYGLASGMVSTMRLIGQMISLGIAMLTFSVIMGHVEIAPAQMDELMVSIKVAFGIFAGLCLMGMLFSLARGKMQREQTAL